MKQYTIQECVDWAVRDTRKAAACKKWRLARNIDRRMAEIAKSIAEKGYIISTPGQLAKKYPDVADTFFSKLSPENDRKMIWGIDLGLPNLFGRVRPFFCVYHKF